MIKRIKNSKATKIAYMGLLFALSITLSFIESIIPFTGIFPPGVKLGLSNVVTMYMLFFVGAGQAFTLVVLKSFFVFLIRGFVSSVMSFSGGILSVVVMLIVLAVFKKREAYLLLSICGAVSHNIGQLFASVLVLANTKVLWYFPPLFVSGILMGVLTSLVLKAVLPAIKKAIDIDIIKGE